MSERILVLTGAYHLGDNPGLFGGATWVGDRLSLPMRVEYAASQGDPVLLVEVHDLDVWQQGWPGHHVFVDDQPVGRLLPPFEEPAPVPPGGQVGPLRMPQVAVVNLGRERLKKGMRFRLVIAVDRQGGDAPLLDDFLITRIESVDWVIRPGW